MHVINFSVVCPDPFRDHDPYPHSNATLGPQSFVLWMVFLFRQPYFRIFNDPRPFHDRHFLLCILFYYVFRPEVHPKPELWETSGLVSPDSHSFVGINGFGIYFRFQRSCAVDFRSYRVANMGCLEQSSCVGFFLLDSWSVWYF